MAMGNFLEVATLNSALRGGTFPTISTPYVSLFTTDPGETGTTGAEVSGGGYTRKAGSFTAPAQVDDEAVVYNSTEIDYGVATATWGNITHAAIFDAATGGNLLFHVKLTSEKLIETNDSLRFAPNKLAVYLS